MAFPQEFIERLKQANPILNVIGRYAQLKRAGSNTVCRCPFHSEKTPSFTIFPDDHFYCFGCGAGGDVITFTMKIENVDYPSAVEILADRAGLALPDQDRTYQGPKVDTKRLFALNACAARFYYDKLVSPEGKYARDYLVSRGFDLKQISRFGLGFADSRKNWDELCSHLVREGYAAEEIKTMFLGGINKNGRLFDYFRNRIVFPVIDASGRVVAFSGRFIGTPGENDRKYFNTSDTPVYKKSRNLYGLNIAKNAKKNWLILCEGNMDAVALQAAGFDNSVAGLGTALTVEQVSLIKRYAETVYICYDSDEAGVKAADKAMRLLSSAGVSVKVLKLDGAKDPDEYIRKFGKNKFSQLIEGANGQMEYRFRNLVARFDLSNMDGRKALIDSVLPLLAENSSELEAEIYLQKLSNATQIPAETLRRSLALVRRREAAKAKKEISERAAQNAGGYILKAGPGLKFSTNGREENLIGILLLRKEYLLDEKLRARLSPSLFENDLNRRAVEKLLELTSDGAGFDWGKLGESFGADEIGVLSGYSAKRAALADNGTDVLFEILDSLEKKAADSGAKDEPLETWLSKLKKDKTKDKTKDK
ncbi:MAG: DNA primase [Clostridia bacterium]|nr:DNA primase [Clostridia bacterium]